MLFCGVSSMMCSFSDAGDVRLFALSLRRTLMVKESLIADRLFKRVPFLHVASLACSLTTALKTALTC